MLLLCSDILNWKLFNNLNLFNLFEGTGRYKFNLEGAGF